MMVKKSVDDVLQEGIYGKKELHPEERRKFLGTLRERIVAALRQSQVREKETYPELIELMKQHPQAKLYLNGALNITFLKKYITAADKHKLDYTVVINKNHDTDIGLVLAYDYAVDQEEIFLSRPKKQQKPAKNSKLASLFNWLRRK
ncbi:YueI family protein [Pseudobacillus badius]|uniref:YueI family protein n=1 Tax=Bacillus badius TaxID=1455 RepID=UPI003CF31FAF